jgi:magnesium-transporting ATPase (P-type)
VPVPLVVARVDGGGVDRRHAVLPFDSERRYIASTSEPSIDDACRVTYFKGAPEVLLAHVDPAQADAARTVLDAWDRRARAADDRRRDRGTLRG